MALQMHPLALKSGIPPLAPVPPPLSPGTSVHTKMHNTFFYDSDESQVEQKPIFHSGTVVSYVVDIHSWNLYFW